MVHKGEITSELDDIMLLLLNTCTIIGVVDSEQVFFFNYSKSVMVNVF